jgi:Putative Actinobacterial Holin-X, holin superfamily III
MTSFTPGAVESGMPAPRRPEPADVSVGELVEDLTRDLSTLVRQELQLAKAEVKQEAVKTGRAVGKLGAASFAGYMASLFLSLAVAVALAHVIDLTWAMLVVAVIWAIVGMLLYSTGRRQLRDVNPKPERTVETLREVPATMRGR